MWFTGKFAATEHQNDVAGLEQKVPGPHRINVQGDAKCYPFAFG